MLVRLFFLVSDLMLHLFTVSSVIANYFLNTSPTLLENSCKSSAYLVCLFQHYSYLCCLTKAVSHS